MKKDEATKKIAKLKALSTSDNENEANRALELMSKFMEKHGITKDMLKDLNEDVAKVKKDYWMKPNDKQLKSWEIRLASTVAKLFSSRIILDGNGITALYRQKLNKILFLGVEDDCKVSREMYVWVNDILWKVSHEKACETKQETDALKVEFKIDYPDKEFPKELRFSTNRFVQSFLQGAVYRIENRIGEILEKRKVKYESNSTAMMVIDKKIQKIKDELDKMNLEDTKNKFNISDLEGFRQGTEEGDKINLDKQLEKSNDLGQGLLR